MDPKSAPLITAPTTVREYIAAVESTGSGQFMSRFSDDGRAYFASNYGAPFFAISNLAPEVLEAPNATVVFGGAVGTMAAEGGRWLSLYAKGLKTSCKLACTVCVRAKPRPTKAPKPLLFQPPQRMLVKTWSNHLRESGTMPDVLVLYAEDSFGEHLAAIDELAEITLRCNTLMSFQSGAEASIIQRLLRARGFEVSEVLGFDTTEGERQNFARGAWWLSISPTSPDRLTAASEELTSALRACYGTYEVFINRADNAAAVAAVYGTRAAVRVSNEDVANAVLMNSDGGIDLSTGRMFSRPENSNSDDVGYNWDQMQLNSAVLDLAPENKPDLSPDENRFQLMLWLGRALREFGGDLIDESRRGDEEEASTPNVVNVLSSECTSPGVDLCDPTTESLSINSQPATVTTVDPVETTPAKSRPQRSRLSRGAGTVNVLAIAARLGGVDKKAGNAFENARSLILGWLKNKGFAELNPTSNGNVEYPYGEVSIETDGKSVWSMRFDDRQRMEGGAFWRVEATLVGQHEPAFGLRLAQVRRTEDAPEPVSGAPTVVAKIASEVGMQDAGVSLLNRSVALRGEADAKRLINLLQKPDRTQPVIVISLANRATPDTSVDRLAARLVGLAHVFSIDGTISSNMIRTLGRERSVFGNAIRLYRPGFTAESDPFQHRVWTFGGAQLPVLVANDIAEEACAISLEVGDVDERVPSFIAIRNMLSETRIETLRKQTVNIASTAKEERSRQEAIRVELESVLAKYKSQSEELAQEVSQLQGELLATRRERDSALDDARQMRRQLDNRWTEDDIQNGDLADESYYPDSWDDLEEWIEIYGEGKLELLPQAAKAARESPFKDIPFAYKALEYLVRYYVPMRTRDKNDTQAYQNSQQVLAELGLELSKVGTALDDSRYKQEYRRQYDSRNIWLDDHLKKGVGFDPAVIFRLYFHFDEATAKVVVGHLPTHLTNRITHSG